MAGFEAVLLWGEEPVSLRKSVEAGGSQTWQDSEITSNVIDGVRVYDMYGKVSLQRELQEYRDFDSFEVDFRNIEFR